MSVILATKTLARIDEMMRADQGSSYRGWLGKVIPHIGDAYRTGEDGFRSHLGASVLGDDCARKIWYGFRWAVKALFPAHTLRLFNRGHLEEARFIALLLMIGCEVYQQDKDGKQYRISWADGHAGGSGDGVVMGIPDVPVGTAVLLECKTHGDKSFTELAGKLETNWSTGDRKFVGGKGVREAKFEHYIQIQTYMRKMGLVAALYLAVNKNDDSLYGEIIILDTILADQFLDRGEKIVYMTNPPRKVSQTVSFYKCRFCDYKAVCHNGEAPGVNCRTCSFSKPIADGKWYCDWHNTEIPKATQLTGCANYAKHGPFNS